MQGGRRWIIRDAQGRIEGPFTTEKILYKIGRGEFTGEEYISHFPNGRWFPISQDPQFYDKLLEVLGQNPDVEPTEQTRILEFTRRQDTVSQVPEEKVEVEVKVKKEPPAKTAPAKKKRRKPSEDIELVDMRPKFWAMVRSRARAPLVAIVAVVAVASILLVSHTPHEERLHLIAPQKGINQVAPASLKPRVQQAVAEFIYDSFHGYLKAENDFVYVIERNSRNAEVMALLCMTYLELWPYAYQDSGDQRAISTVVQMSSVVDPGGIHSSTCRAVDLALRSRLQEARSLVDAVLQERASGDQNATLFYYLKAYLLEATGDHASALSYLNTAEHLWPEWLLPFVLEASSLTKLDKFNEAGNLYRKILERNPRHTPARIELGILEYKVFKRLDQAERYLSQAMESDEAPKSQLSRGFFGLAEIALARGNQSGALKFAKKSYALNPSNQAAKNLVVQLGGMPSLKQIPVLGKQLLYDGDQFFREGDYNAAQAHYKAAFEEDPKNGLAALKAAQCLWKLSFSTEAIEWLEKAIKAEPNLMEAYVTLADYQAQRFNFLAAVRVLDQARQVNPNSHEVFRGYALVELTRNNPKSAVSFGKQALSLYDGDVETLIILAQASLALHDYKMAFNYAAKATELDVNHRKAQVAYAQALAGLQGVDVGVEYLLRLVNNYDAVPEYRLALGRMLLADERYQQAEEIFRQIIKLNDKPKEAYVELARVLRAQGNMDEALDLLLKAAVLDPADAEPLFVSGIIYLEQHKPQLAQLQFNRVLTINKLYPQVHYQMGRAALQLNDPRKALDYTEAEKTANPNLAEAYLLAADAHTLLNQYSLCANEYQKAIKLRPQQANIYVKLAQCERKAGHLDSAIAMLNVASSKESGLADIYKEQGAIYEIKGEVVHAIEAYQQYFVLDPDAPDRQQIEERISALQRGQTP